VTFHNRHFSTCVYALVDPRDGQPFYIGISIQPRKRYCEHRNDPASAAWQRIREIVHAGYECEIEILEEFSDRFQAKVLEFRLLTSLPNLVNIDRRLPRGGA
jgi:predicted GIY-YIG superfamily endonuclease